MNNIISIIDDTREEIGIYFNKIKEVFSFVGEGVYDIKLATIYHKLYGKWINDVSIIFQEKPEKELTKEEWNNIEYILEKMISEKEIVDFIIVYNQNQIILTFDGVYELKEYI